MTGRPDDRLRAAYAAYGADAPDTPHPAPELIAAAAERQGAEVERMRTLDHIATCTACRKEFDLLRATHDAARQMTPSTWRLRGFGIAAAAAVVIAATLTIARWNGPHAGVAQLDRSAGSQKADHAITLVAPIGFVSPHATRFIWHSVRTANGYHLEVLDDSGAVALRTDTRETTYVAPQLAPSRTYQWWVQARVNGEAWRSEFGEIKTAPTAP
jgi:hypothetical protein